MVDPNIPEPMMGQLSDDEIAQGNLFPGEVCNCSDKQICHLCPEVKKRRLLNYRTQGGDPNTYVAPLKQHGKDEIPSKREAKKKRKEIQRFLSNRFGRRVTNDEMSAIITQQANKVRERMQKEMLQQEAPHSEEKQCAHDIAPKGWFCVRMKGHDGPCAAVEKP